MDTHICLYVYLHISMLTHTEEGEERDLTDTKQESLLKSPLSSLPGEPGGHPAIRWVWSSTDPWKGWCWTPSGSLETQSETGPCSQVQGTAQKGGLPESLVRKSKTQRAVLPLFRLPVVNPRLVLSLALRGVGLRGWARTFSLRPIGWALSSMKRSSPGGTPWFDHLAKSGVAFSRVELLQDSN